ncbi:nuclear transport factor 2 family protein [Dyadobacter sp. 676]|uniref:Nuclear transport factor 2 family protein n=1 Tax=Dyadobacter sp. 676 TaxID=3088362 RepID=A0AAU8FXD3_9BACT
MLHVRTKDYIVNNPNGKISGVADIIAPIRNAQKFPEVERTNEKSTFNHNLAIVVGSQMAAGSTQQDRVKRRLTNVWIRRKQGGNWLPDNQQIQWLR